MLRIRQLAWVVGAAVLATAGLSHAQNAQPALRLAARVETYLDTDATTVVRPRVSVDGALGERWRASGSYMADVVSSASVDVITRATQGVHEVRHEGNLGVSHRGANDAISTLAYAYGHEPDFRNNSITASHARTLDAAERTYLTARAGYSHARIGTVADQSFLRVASTASASLSISRVLRKTTVLRIGLETSAVLGFQSSAYRTVRIGDWSAYRYTGTDPDAGTWVFTGVTSAARENHPNARYRGRLALDLVQSLGARVAISLAGAVYRDSWGVTAAEVAPELRFEGQSGWLLRVGARAYVQSAAWFFRRRYANTTDTRGYQTDDKELGTMRSYAAHVAAQIPIGPVRLDARVEGIFYRYTQFTLLPQKEALVFTLGVSYQR